ncbi:MAG TPA: hypothetical protein VN878_07385 [Usitatibacter sp.]|nr:hypothetical protein [Usitatibacter sp.]
MSARAVCPTPAALMAALLVSLCLGWNAWAKLPPPPPPDEKAKAAAEAKKAKDAIAAEEAKRDQTSAEDRAVKSFQSTMRKSGRPVPKPTPIAAAPAALMPGPTPAPAAPTPTKAGKGASRGMASAKGHEKGAMTPAGNTPANASELPKDAQKK